MRFVDVMKEEHRQIRAMLSVLDAAASHLERGGEIEPAVLSGMIDWFEDYAGGHHVCEERTLFPLLAKRGLGPDKVVVSVLLSQHDAGRAYTKKMRESLQRIRQGDGEGKESFVSHVRGYLELIREHIRIEDEYFYRLAEELLSANEAKELLKQLEVSEGSHGRGARLERYSQMLAEYQSISRMW
jgi:hemerythrin-like domain-containing protein